MSHDYTDPMWPASIRAANYRSNPEQSVEIERLRAIVTWCRPRLKIEAYRANLDAMLADPEWPAKNEPKLVQS